ncbi:MAG: MBOAT family O-acyltransferase [Bdellovibrionota bacterium]
MQVTHCLFFGFVCLVLLAYWIGPLRCRIPLLLAASYFWYASLDLKYLPLLLIATFVDFFAAKAMEHRPDSRRRWLFFSLAVNLGILATFKLSPLAAPLGVSFYTFHSLSYVFDVYRRRIPAESSLIKYSLFVSFFPKLQAGPIERFESFKAHLEARPAFRMEWLETGITLTFFGLFLKLVVGDSLSLLVDKAFDGGARPDLALLGAYAYSAQIYADFLGYTLIARGVAQCFAIPLDRNFHHPYLATSPRDFWRRWHRSLSFWFRDYVYIPLGGGRSHWLRNVLLTMVIAGAWHGASTKFLLWGIYHGVFLAIGVGIETLAAPWMAQRGSSVKIVARALAWFATLQVTCLGWIFFRAASVSAAWDYFHAVFHAGIPAKGDIQYFLLFVAPWALAGFALRGIGAFPMPPLLRKSCFALTAGACFVAILILGDPVAVPFIYFKF